MSCRKKTWKLKKVFLASLYPSNLEMLGSARMAWFVDAAAI
ncbi:hypothetical protein N646_4599 [Vibrio alginolyticus NBRC 15630 = ATCC 17749]|uniref:Uncharacterized protein n=1 Tax=Vibrio alginolyticus (strain ATCC 17749 / DSM 2171 / NBRC 15630 / NCIMB 1903 / NCTC 12160 / XII-53) TaxID=1219076 RepID=A0A2I3CS75_VIBAX|nr:hypothetical protein N646_4599 [Vibrio alginolyticus NBRC 15630 = ATCC 17749]